MLVLRWLIDLLGLNPRGLFVFYDGRRRRRVDPLDVTRKLFSDKSFDWDETPKLLSTGNAMIQLAAFSTIAIAVRAAFAIPSVERGGLTEIQCLELLTQFREYLGEVKKNGSLFPMSRESTESVQSQDPSEFPTKPGWGSGSTEIEQFVEPVGSQAVPTADS